MRTKKIKTESNSVVVVVKEMETSSPPLSESHDTGIANGNSDSIDNNSNNENINLVEVAVENVTLNTVIVEKKKRGRKKLIRPETNCTDSQTSENVENHKVDVDENSVSEKCAKNNDEGGTTKKERKQYKLKIDKQQNKEVSSSECNEETPSLTLTNVVVHKKRGRKPRGGKIIHENQMQSNNSPEVPNIILHLKCVLSDLKKSNELNSNRSN